MILHRVKLGLVVGWASVSVVVAGLQMTGRIG